MRIVFITSSLGYGGAAKMLSFVANNLSTENEVHVVAYSSISSVPVFNPGIQVYLLGGILKDCGHIKRIRVLHRFIKDISPDIIVSFLTFPNMYSVILGKIVHTPVIVSERGNPYVSRGIKMRIVYSIINHADGAVFQTEGAKSFFSKSLQQRSVIIPNPVVKRNTQVNFNLDCDNHEIVFVGRLENKQKRVDLLFEAFSLIIKVYEDAKLVVYGDGQDEQLLKRKALQLDCANSIFFKGKTIDPEKAMTQSEVFVISSDYEGIPNSLIEAMSVGMPVVATDCDPGGARLLIKDGINGYLVPKGNAELIASRVVAIFDNKNLREKFSQAAKEICITYSESRISEMWSNYLMIISRA